MFSRREFSALAVAGLTSIASRCGFGKSEAGALLAKRTTYKIGPDALIDVDPRQGTFAWRRVPIFAGGFVIGLDIAQDGSRFVHWADVFNGYIRQPGDKAWQLILREDSLARSEYDPRPKGPTTDLGIYAARIAPSNPNRLYVSWNGRVYRSDDGGAHFISTGFAPRRMQSNLGPQRRFNRAIDVDPRNPDRVIVGTNNDGVHLSTNAGKTWKQLNLPAAAKLAGGEGKYLVGFARNGSVYVHVPGTGLFHSPDGSAFTAIGGPAFISCLVVSGKGHVFVCEYRHGQNTDASALKRWNGAGWTAIKCPADQVAVDPFDENHLFAVGENLLGSSPVIRRSRDGGQNWTSHAFRRGAGEVAWLSDRDKASFPAQILFDPVVRGKIWMADGVGVSWSTAPESGEPWVLHDWSLGNAELVPTQAVTVPGQPPILCFWDKPLWRLDDDQGTGSMWSYPVPDGKAFSQNTVTVGFGVDYAADDPSFLVAVAGQGDNRNGWSVDGGRTWTEFASKPASPFKFGGAVAVSTKKNFVVLSSNNGSGAFTVDGGATWQPVSFGGYEPVLGWSAAYYINRLNIAADKTRKGVFAAVVHNIVKTPDGRDAVGRDIAGLWLSQDGGATWKHQFRGVLQGSEGVQHQFWQCRLRYVPGRTGELLYADCSNNPGNRLMWSRDDGRSWIDVSRSVRNVLSFGFGKPARSDGPPAVYFDGLVDGKRGIYASYDWFRSKPMLLAERPLNTIGQVVDVNGDLNIFGRCYAMLGGNGAALCDFSSKAKVGMARTPSTRPP